MITQQTIDDLKHRLDIVDVISTRWNLKKIGMNYQAVCPFHDEKTPSFSVSPKKQIYKCFGCGAGGDVIEFIQAYDGIGFISAVDKLSEMAGISVDKTEEKLIPKILRENSFEDKAMILICQSHLDCGGRLNYSDKQRYKLAVARQEQIEGLTQ